MSQLGFERIRRAERDGDWARVANSPFVALVGPGQTFEWDGRAAMLNRFWPTEGDPTNWCAKVLVGDGIWARSQDVPVRVVAGSPRFFPAVFTGVVQNSNFKTIIRQGSVEDSEYLFAGGFRICEVPAGSKPAFDWDGVARLLAVRFPGATSGTVYWAGRWARTLTEEEYNARRLAARSATSASISEHTNSVSSYEVAPSGSDAQAGDTPSRPQSSSSATATVRQNAHSTGAEGDTVVKRQQIGHPPWPLIALGLAGSAMFITILARRCGRHCP